MWSSYESQCSRSHFSRDKKKKKTCRKKTFSPLVCNCSLYSWQKKRSVTQRDVTYKWKKSRKPLRTSRRSCNHHVISRLKITDTQHAPAVSSVCECQLTCSQLGGEGALVWWLGWLWTYRAIGRSGKSLYSEFRTESWLSNLKPIPPLEFFNNNTHN